MLWYSISDVVSHPCLPLSLKIPAASSPFALWWPSHLIRWLVWACYMGAGSGNCTGFPPGFWVLFGTLILICKAQHALMFHQSPGMLFCSQSLLWDPSCGMSGYSLLHKPPEEEMKVMPWMSTLWLGVEREIAEHPPAQCGGREWDAWAVLHQVPCCGGILRVPLAS